MKTSELQQYQGEFADYYSQSRRWTDTIIPALNQIIPPADGDRTLLDIGCGTGDLIPLAENKGYHYVGLDISYDMLLSAEQSYPNAQLVNADAGCLPFSSSIQSIDVISSIMMLPVVGCPKKLQKIFVEFERVLKPDG